MNLNSDAIQAHGVWRVLVVEDNVGLRRLIRKRLEREEYDVIVVETGEEAIRELLEYPETILLLDYKLPDMNGRELIQYLLEKGRTVPFIIMTGHGDERVAVEMMKLGARDYLVKDHSLLEVLPQVLGQVFSQVSTEKKLTEVSKKLVESEERFKVLFNSGTDAIFVQDFRGGGAGRFIEVNEIACDRLAYSRDQLLSMEMSQIESFSDIIDVDQVQKTLREKKYLLYETVQVARDGRQIPVENNAQVMDLNGRPAILCISRDITQRKQLEDQLRQAQKMDAIGKLAGGVAHDFNNLLTAIMGYSDLLLVKMREENPFREVVHEIKKAGERAASLTRQLLAFSRKQVLKPTVVDLNLVVNGMGKMLKRIIGEDLRLTTQLEPDVRNIRADFSQVEQVLLNLAVNAADAMATRTSSGILTIKTENKAIDETLTNVMPHSRPGHFVCLSVSDNGSGIDKKLLPHIFEPFFTTKTTGTGLGLSVVYGIINQHNGWINVYSEKGEGTTFRIYFPVLPGEEEKGGEGEVILQEYIGNGERVLLVEDEDGVRNVAKKVLSDYGYTVFDAESVARSMEITGKEKGRFDLIASDIVLPDGNGIDLTEEICSQYPEIKVLLTSGYADHRAHWEEVVKKGIPFMQKPYSLLDLLKNVKEVLEGIS